MTIDIATGIFFLIGLVGLSVVNELVKLLFNRMRTSDYMTKVNCDQARSSCLSGRQKEEQDVQWDVETLSKKVDSLTRLMIQMAIKVGIDSKDIEKIV